MASTLRITRRMAGRSTVTQTVHFNFRRIAAGATVFTRSFRASGTGFVFVSQRRATGATTTPSVQYTIVNATTMAPVTNSVTLTGTQTRLLTFVVPTGTFRLRIRNVGRSAVAVRGTIF